MVPLLALGFAVLAVLALTVVRPVVQLGSPAVALAAPASIDGLPKTADLSSQPVSVFGKQVLTVASATYGTGDVHYAVVAISGALADPRTLIQTLTPTVAGDDSLDQSAAVHVQRSGIDYTCWRMLGDTAGVTCTWDNGGVAGVVVQVGSQDATRCVAFADIARQSLARG